MVMFVFVAIGMLITFYLVKTLTAKEPPRRVATRNVPLTLTELVPGTVIKQGDVGLGPAPADQIVGDILLSVEALHGRVVKEHIPVTEFICGSDLYPSGQLPPLKLVDGWTAFTISQSSTAAMVEGLIKPDDHVDIYYSPSSTADPRYQKIGGMTIKLFKGVRIIAINRSFLQSDLSASENSVTVEIRKDDAALMLLASNTGTLTLSYTRDASGQATVKVADPDRPTLEELLQLPPVPEEPEEPEPARYTTNVWRRGGRQSLSFVYGVPAGYPVRLRPVSASSSRCRTWKRTTGLRAACRFWWIAAKRCLVTTIDPATWKSSAGTTTESGAAQSGCGALMRLSSRGQRINQPPGLQPGRFAFPGDDSRPLCGDECEHVSSRGFATSRMQFVTYVYPTSVNPCSSLTSATAPEPARCGSVFHHDTRLFLTRVGAVWPPWC